MTAEGRAGQGAGELVMLDSFFEGFFFFIEIHMGLGQAQIDRGSVGKRRPMGRQVKGTVKLRVKLDRRTFGKRGIFLKLPHRTGSAGSCLAAAEIAGAFSDVKPCVFFHIFVAV